jgi:signal transduction histidine kinase
MNMKRWLAPVVLALVCQAPVAAFAAGKDEAVAMVNKAVAYLKQNGQEKALAEFNKTDGQFVKGELYVVVLDMNGVVLADGNKPKLVGKALIEVKDVNGKAFVREELDMARSKGKGWVDFMWFNPETKAMAPRSSYFEKVGEVIVLTGVYN